MNRYYTTALALAFIAGGAFAQQVSSLHGNMATKKSRYAPMHHGSNPIEYSGDRLVIWSNDFSVPADWTIGSEPGADTDELWVIGTTGSTGPFQIGTIASTTAANGFALYDSDLLCGGNQHSWVATVNPIDLSAYPGAVLQFEQLFRRFRGDTYVDISTDGTAWTEFEVNDAVAVNGMTPNPELYSLNISAVAGGQATVWIRFRYYSTIAVHGNLAGCDYAWMVDDVALVTLPDNEIRMDYGFTSHTGNGEEYGRIPTEQLNPTMNVGAQVFNFGGQDATNVVVTMSLLNEALVEVATATETFPLIASQDTAIMDQDITLPALPVGLYTANFTMTSDQIGSDDNPDNNTAVRTFRVTDDLYTADGIDDHPAGLQVLSQTGTNSFTDNTENVKLLNYYEVRTEMDATGVLIELGPLTNAGSFFSISIYDTTDVFANDLSQPLAETSDFHVITAAEDAAGTAWMALDEPLTLQPGGYYVSANMYADGNAHLYILDDETVAQPNTLSMLWLENDPQQLYGGNGTAWAVRLSSDASIGMSENDELTGVSMYPNPTNGIVHIATEHSGNHILTVINVLGEVVATTNFAGTTKLDLNAYTDGVYSLRVANEKGSTVQRITLAR